MGDELFTFKSLATLGGSATVVYLVVQTVKEPLDRKVRIPTQLFATIIAFIVLVGAMIATGADVASWQTYFLALANAFLVAAAAGKMFDDARRQGGAEVADAYEATQEQEAIKAGDVE